MPNNRRRLTGVVVSNKMQKTAVVQVEKSYRHPLYGKVVREAKKYMVHDAADECELGDTVVIVESAPISRHKRWVVQEIVRQDISAQQAEVDELEGVSVQEFSASEEEAEEVEPEDEEPETDEEESEDEESEDEE